MEVEQLSQSLEQYKEQLEQISEAMKSTPKGDQFDALVSLKSDLQELIALTNENIEKLQPNKSADKDDPFADEYALFMEEMAKVEGESEKPAQDDEAENSDMADIEDQLKSLEGTKCGVLFANKAGKPSLYNAMVCSILKHEVNDSKDFDTIQVRILFTNPIYEEMVPCPYYLEGSCKFDDQSCKYSHGEIVSLSSLQPAAEPKFSSLKIGQNVLAKIQSEEKSGGKMAEKYLLWHRAVIKSINFDSHQCRVKLESDKLFTSGGKNDYEARFADIFPLNEDSSDSDSDSSDSSDSNDEPCSSIDFSVLPSVNLANISTAKLGDWEKHTRGIGSKLMIKMGYIMGTGLGPQNDGRTEPVPCQVLPAGRSLDHCMDLKEKFDDKDLFKAEKKLLRLQKKTEEREKAAYERAKEREKHNVFNFLNSTLSNHSESKKSNAGRSDTKNETLKDTSCKNLNIEKFKLDENMKKLEKDIVRLRGSIARNGSNSQLQIELKSQLNSKLNDMRDLKSRESKITSEQNNRKDKKKMSVF